MSLKDSVEPEPFGLREALYTSVGVVTFIVMTCMSDWTAGLMSAFIAVFLTEICLGFIVFAVNRFRNR